MSGDAGTSATSSSVAGAAVAAQDGGGNNSSEHVVISMARPLLRAMNQELFTPVSVPIGPYHRASCSNKWQQEKQRVADETVNSLKDGAGAQLMQELGKLEEDVRGCYGGLPDMESEELISMLRNDGCYVLHFFVQYPGLRNVRPPRGENSTVMCDIMYLLENQLPMMVLQRIHQCLMPERSIVDDVEDRVVGLLSVHLYIRGIKKPRGVQAAPCHLLQLVHTYFQPHLEHSSVPVYSGEDTDNTCRRVGTWRRATEYSRYGNVQLKPRKFEHGVESILDVRLEGGTLWIPRLWIDSSTWTILRNLIALEELTGIGGSPVTAYCLFMKQLASKVEDIELLMRKGIVEHTLDNEEEVAQGFADLCKKVVLDVDDVHCNYLRDTWHLLQERCECLRQNCWGLFRHMRVLAFVTASSVFAFQVIQVILAGFSLRQQGK